MLYIFNRVPLQAEHSFDLFWRNSLVCLGGDALLVVVGGSYSHPFSCREMQTSTSCFLSAIVSFTCFSLNIDYFSHESSFVMAPKDFLGVLSSFSSPASAVIFVMLYTSKRGSCFVGGGKTSATEAANPWFSCGTLRWFLSWHIQPSPGR